MQAGSATKPKQGKDVPEDQALAKLVPSKPSLAAQCQLCQSQVFWVIVARLPCFNLFVSLQLGYVCAWPCTSQHPSKTCLPLAHDNKPLGGNTL